VGVIIGEGKRERLAPIALGGVGGGDFLYSKRHAMEALSGGKGHKRMKHFAEGRRERGGRVFRRH